MLNSSGPDNQVFIAICPSGNFYGSEQTLAIYLKHSKLPYLLYMPQDAREEQIQAFQGCENVDLIFFRSERQLYLRIFLALFNQFARGGNASVYLNEAGHFRYFRLLPKVWPFKFVVHVRMLEDVLKRPWRKEDGKILHVISTSKFIQLALRDIGIESQLLSSPYRSINSAVSKARKSRTELIVVSRLCEGKGLKYYEQFCAYVAFAKLNVTIRHFGELDAKGADFVSRLDNCKYVNWILMGYEADKNVIYKTGTLLHLNPDEALGAVLFEAVQYGMPYLTFSEGGTGEVSRNLSLDSFTASVRDDFWERRLTEIWKAFEDETVDIKLEHARLRLESHYSPVEYSCCLDKIMLDREVWIE